MDEIAARIAPDDPPSVRLTTYAAFASMIGTLQLARATTDPALADALLEVGVATVLALFDQPSRGPDRGTTSA